MSKMSVAAVEVVSDAATIPWSKINSGPAYAEPNFLSMICTASYTVGSLGQSFSQSGTTWSLNVAGACNCACACCCACSCIPGGTAILMADGSLVPIEQLEIGDLVETLRGPRKVARRRQTTLGAGRQIIRLGELLISDDHRIWTQLPDERCRSLSQEGWGTYNYSHFLAEVAEGDMPPTAPAALVRTNKHWHATKQGWAGFTPEYHPEYGPETVLYQLEILDGESYIAGGLVVSSYLADGALSTHIKWTGVKPWN